MKKLIIAIIVAAFSSGHTAAQKVRVISATKQNWAGGVAGHWGVNYCIAIKTDEKISLDSVYTNGNGVKLPNDPNGQGSVRYDSVKHTYTINVGESHYDDPRPDPTRLNEADNQPKPVLRQINSPALIVYIYKGRKELLVVKQMDNLPALNYP